MKNSLSIHVNIKLISALLLQYQISFRVEKCEGDLLMTSFLNEIVLYCLYKINGERTIYAIYHLLNGKKTSQTIQDSRLFHLECFFNTYDELTRQQLEKIVEDLEKLHLVEKKSDQAYKLTKKGREQAEKIIHQYSSLQLLNGWKYQFTNVFWERLTLLVQVISNIVHNETKYMPIQKNKDVQGWLKSYLRHLSKKEIGPMLYNELENCLGRNTDIDPAVVVFRFTGYDVIGLTEKQAAEVLAMDAVLYHYQFLCGLHGMIHEIALNKESYPLLGEILRDLYVDVPITESTRKTQELLNKGFQLETIAKMRKLKINTIQDHIVELALHIPAFDIAPYVDPHKQKKIIMATGQITSKQLRHIREQVQDADYFEIRLVLAKYGDGK